MANTYDSLGQSAPSAATLTEIYVVPSATQTVISFISATNRSATATKIRVSIEKDGAATGDEDWLAYDMPIGGNQTIELGRGVTLGATDTVNVYNTLATVSFSVFGVEIT